MEFLENYGLFLLQTVTLVVAFIVVVGVIVSAGQRASHEREGHIEAKLLNDRFKDWEYDIKDVVLNDAQIKQEQKDHKKEQKAKLKAAKKGEDQPKKRLWVLDFDGDIKASAVEQLRHEISSLLTIATKEDEVLVKVESGGGMVHSYGFAASQLQRIRDADIPLTVAVDRVAASGGYMMACIANRIVAAPFAVLGSVGVVAQLPNFNRLLKKHEIDVELHTAGDHKRTLTMFGENTDADRARFREELEDTHTLFKEFVSEHRPQVDIDKIATGETWYGTRALGVALVDEICASDDYMMRRREDVDIVSLRYKEKKSVAEKFGLSAAAGIEALVSKLAKLRAF